MILERHWPSLVRYTTSLLGDSDDAEDVVQQTFIRFWEHRDAWHVDGSALPLLLRIARNLSLDKLRRRATREKAGSSAPRPATQPTPDDVLEHEELNATVIAAVDSLPERRRKVLLLTRLHGLSRTEVAGIMDLAPQTVANHLTLAMNDVRAKLAPHLYRTAHDSGRYVRAGLPEPARQTNQS